MAVRLALPGTCPCVQVRPSSAECSTWPRSPTAKMRGPARARSISNDFAASGAMTDDRAAESSVSRFWDNASGTTASAASASAARRTSARTAPGDRGGREIGGRPLRVEVHGPRLLVVEAECEVAARLQVVGQLKRRPERGNLVIVDRVRFLDPPHLITVVGTINQQDLPGVFVHVKRPPLVDVPLAGLQHG